MQSGVSVAMTFPGIRATMPFMNVLRAGTQKIKSEAFDLCFAAPLTMASMIAHDEASAEGAVLLPVRI